MFKKKTMVEASKATEVPLPSGKKVTIEKKNSFVAPTPKNMEAETKAAGKTSFVAFLKGEHINLRESIEAKCYDCMAYYVDGIGDCGCPDCPLYPFHPYNPTPAKLRKERPDMKKKK